MGNFSLPHKFAAVPQPGQINFGEQVIGVTVYNRAAGNLGDNALQALALFSRCQRRKYWRYYT
jgi:hypothetical protein